MNANATIPAGQVDGAVVAAFDEDADLVSVGHWGSDEPMHVIREGVSLDIDEAAWRAAHGIADPEPAAA